MNAQLIMSNMEIVHVSIVEYIKIESLINPSIIEHIFIYNFIATMKLNSAKLCKNGDMSTVIPTTTIAHMPNEILYTILTKLDLENQLNILFTCKLWYQIINSIADNRDASINTYSNKPQLTLHNLKYNKIKTEHAYRFFREACKNKAQSTLKLLYNKHKLDFIIVMPDICLTKNVQLIKEFMEKNKHDKDRFPILSAYKVAKNVGHVPIIQFFEEYIRTYPFRFII